MGIPRAQPQAARRSATGNNAVTIVVTPAIDFEPPHPDYKWLFAPRRLITGPTSLSMPDVTLTTLGLKQSGEKIAMLTCF